MRRQAVHAASLALALYGAPYFGPDSVRSGPQVGKRVAGLFHPVAVHFAANPQLNGKRINLVCHYGHNPTVMVFARDVGPELEGLVRRLDAEVGRLRGFRLAACVVLLTDLEPAQAEKKLRALLDRTKATRVTLAHLDSAGPRGYDIAREAAWTVLHYERYKVAANQAVKKADAGKKAVNRVIADIDRIIPAIKVWAGVALAAGESQSLKLLVRRDRVRGR